MSRADTPFRLRAATLADATHLAALVDIASEGFASYFWRELAEAGQSPFEIGRSRAMRDHGAFTWRNATIAEVAGEVAGCLVGYRIADRVDPAEIAAAAELVRPLVALEAEAAGHWYVNVLAVFPEYRGSGIGAALLARADELGRESRAPGMAIIVASENDGAMRLYRRAGYASLARRPLVAFPGLRRGGDWVLMTKPCG